MLVYCSKCKKNFEMFNNDLKENYLGSMLTEIYYKCKNCGEKYVVALESAKAREIKRKRDKLILEKTYASNDIKDKIDSILLDKEIDELSLEYKKEMDRVNRRK